VPPQGRSSVPVVHVVHRPGKPPRQHRAPAPPSPAPYLALLRRIVARVREHYLAKVPLERTDQADPPRLNGIVYPTAQARRAARLLGRPVPRPAYNLATPLAPAVRAVRSHGISATVDAFVQPDALAPALDALGASIGSHADREFSALLTDGARAAGGFRPGVREIALEDVAPGFVEPFRRRNLDLITAMVEGQVSDLETVLRENVGLNGRELQALIVNRCGVTERHAALLARDQTLKMSADVAQLRAENVGATKYVWLTSNDERVRGRPGGKWAKSQSNHWDLQGKTFSYDSPPVTDPVTGVTNAPGQDYNCRCTASPDLSHVFGEEPWDGRSETSQETPEAPAPTTFGGVPRAEIPHDPIAHETHAVFGGLDLGAVESESSGIVRNSLDDSPPVVQSPGMSTALEIAEAEVRAADAARAALPRNPPDRTRAGKAAHKALHDAAWARQEAAYAARDAARAAVESAPVAPVLAADGAMTRVQAAARVEAAFEGSEITPRVWTAPGGGPVRVYFTDARGRSLGFVQLGPGGVERNAVERLGVQIERGLETALRGAQITDETVLSGRALSAAAEIEEENELAGLPPDAHRGGLSPDRAGDE